MVRIAVCDDEKLFRENIRRHLEKYLIKKGISFEIDMFSSGEEFLGLGIETVRYSVIFLDINMGKINGITTAAKIREYSLETYIVFVTAYIDFSLEGYKVDAARYLLKNNINFDAALYECMDTILKKMNYVVLKKTFKFNECQREVMLERILYVESRLHKLEFHVMEDNLLVYTMYGILNDLEKEMQGFHFLRIHQSFLVNLKHIKKIDGYKAVLSSEQELVIPKARYREVKNTFIAYRGEI